MLRIEKLKYYRDVLCAAAERSPEHLRLARARLGRTDLFFMLVFLLGRKDVNRDWLYDRCNEVQVSPDDHLDLWAREFYKDLADNTPILTHNRGWTTHGELEIGDSVYAPDGSPIRVIALSQRYFDSPCSKITFSDGASIVAGKGHLWRVRRKIKRRVGDWHDNLRRIEWDYDIIPTGKLPYRGDIGVLEQPVCGIPSQLPLDPYVLGAWLGDGNSDGPRITVGYLDADEMETNLRGRGIQVKRARHSNSVTLSIGSGVRGKKGSSDVMNALRILKLVRNKHIPEIYLRSCAHQRTMLLKGLMDTDGYCSNRGHAVFVNSNERLARNVYDLAVGLALRPRLGQYHTLDQNGRGSPSWRVQFQAHADRNPFMLKRKGARAIQSSKHRKCRDVVSIDSVPSVPTRCIQVEGGMYVAGYELIPTHNSTIITYAKTIQDIVCDPEITVGLFSHTRPIAKGFLRQIKREFESNELLKSVYSDVLWESPHKDAPKWNEDDGIVVKRKSNPKESTVEAWGVVDGQPTSRHFSLLVYDDLVTRESVTTPDMIHKTTEALSLSYNLGTSTGRRRFIGTRYHFNDSYGEVIRRGTVIPRIYPATKDGTPDGEPVFMSREELDQKRRDMGNYVYASQMLQNPRADETQGFQSDWLRYYDNKKSDGGGMNRYILCDPASSKKKESDYTAIGVIGLGTDNNYYMLDLVRDRLNLRERGDAIFSLHRRWRPHGVGYEKYGIQADIEYLQERMEHENYRFQITPVGGQVAKPDRIRSMIPIFEQGRFYLPESMWKTDYQGQLKDLVTAFVEEEYKPFPVGLHDDIFDMLSRITDENLNAVWPRSKQTEDRYSKPKNRRHKSSSWMAA